MVDIPTEIFVELCRADASYSPANPQHDEPHILVEDVGANALACMHDLVASIPASQRARFYKTFDTDYLPRLIELLRDYNFEVD